MEEGAMDVCGTAMAAHMHRSLNNGMLNSFWAICAGRVF
jgi:hypothetical protein